MPAFIAICHSLLSSGSDPSPVRGGYAYGMNKAPVQAEAERVHCPQIDRRAVKADSKRVFVAYLGCIIYNPLITPPVMRTQPPLYPVSGTPEDRAEMAEVIDDAIPARGYQMLPVVGLGGSAALRTFFERMPANSGMAFVVILHLSPEHESLMAEILQRSSTMPVIKVRLEEKVEANRVYVIPPGKHLSIEKGKLRLSDLWPERGRRVALDLFLRTLAEFAVRWRKVHTQPPRCCASHVAS